MNLVRKTVSGAFGCALAAAGALGFPVGAASALTCHHPEGGVDIASVGDLNHSGAVNVADALCTILCTLATQSSQPLSSVSCLSALPQVADPSCDGTTSILDVYAVVALSLGAPLPSGLAPDANGCPAACASCAPEGAGSCLIGGICVPEGARTGQDGCGVCVPGNSAKAYTQETCIDYCADADIDGYGDPSDAVCRCTATAAHPTPFCTDCDDDDTNAFPGAVEVCDGTDNDCNGQIDEVGCTQSGETCQTILQGNPLAASGIYTIDPDGPEGMSAFSVYCDMETDGGGWTVFYAATGANGEQALVSDVAQAGDPLAFQHFNLTRAQKMAIAAVSRQTLFVRSTGPWIRVETPAVDSALGGPNTQRNFRTIITANDGARARATVGYANYQYAGGGDFGIVVDNFDNHSPSYRMLNNSCVQHYLYSYSGTEADFDAGYDVNTALGSWTATAGCHPPEGGSLAFYAAMRFQPVYPSCERAQAELGTAPSGIYHIDPDGEGGVAPFPVYCDMVTDGGGWTLFHSATGADDELPIVGDTYVGGDVLNFQHYNLTRAQKMAIAAVSQQSLFHRSTGPWLRAEAAAVDSFLATPNSQRTFPTTITANNGATASAVLGYANYQYAGGGDYGIVTTSFDNHSSNYRMLNSSCVNSYLYSYSSTQLDFDAGYDINTSLGTWTATTSCQAAEGGLLNFRSSMRARPTNGSSAAYAAQNCRVLKQNYPHLPSGTYFIKPSGFAGAAFQVYCDMTTDGGGWTLLTTLVKGAAAASISRTPSLTSLHGITIAQTQALAGSITEGLATYRNSSHVVIASEITELAQRTWGWERLETSDSSILVAHPDFLFGNSFLIYHSAPPSAAIAYQPLNLCGSEVQYLQFWPITTWDLPVIATYSGCRVQTLIAAATRVNADANFSQVYHSENQVANIFVR